MILKTAHAASKFINYVRRDESSAQVYVRHSVHLKVSTNITDKISIERKASHFVTGMSVAVSSLLKLLRLKIQIQRDQRFHNKFLRHYISNYTYCLFF